MDKVQVLHADGRSSVTYTYTIRNRDRDDLYVLDPQRVNTNFFHDFQNGVRGQRIDADGDGFAWPNPRPDDGEPTPWGKVDLAWFSLLKSGESMTRTVVMKDLPPISSGRYECCMVFGSPEYFHGSTGKVTEELRRQPDGRIWLGQIRAMRTVDVAGT